MNQWQTDLTVMVICCLSAASGAAASLANATRLDVCSLAACSEPSKRLQTLSAGCMGESAMHPCSAAPSPNQNVSQFRCTFRKSNIHASPKTSKLHGRLLQRKLQLPGWKVEELQFMWL